MSTPRKSLAKTFALITIATIIFVSLVSTLIFLGCSNSNNSNNTGRSVDEGSRSAAVESNAESYVSLSKSAPDAYELSYIEEAYTLDEQDENNSSLVKDEEKIIYQANVSITTLSFEDSYAALKDIMQEYKTIISSETIYGESKQNASFSIKVPAENFDAFVSKLEDIGNITTKQVFSDNISKRYNDTQSLISSLEVQEKRLLELASSAENVTDLLEIEDRLQDVRAELTQSKNYLSEMDTDVAYSTVNIELTDVSTVTNNQYEKEGLGKRLGNAFTESWSNFIEGFKNLIVFIAGNWTGLLVLIVVAFLIKIIIRKKRNKKDGTAKHQSHQKIKENSNENNS